MTQRRRKKQDQHEKYPQAAFALIPLPVIPHSEPLWQRRRVPAPRPSLSLLLPQPPLAPDPPLFPAGRQRVSGPPLRRGRGRQPRPSLRPRTCPGPERDAPLPRSSPSGGQASPSALSSRTAPMARHWPLPSSFLCLPPRHLTRPQQPPLAGTRIGATCPASGGSRPGAAPPHSSTCCRRDNSNRSSR